MARSSYATKPTPYEQAIIDSAESYSAYLFLSRANRRSIPCETLERAVSAAQQLANTYRRPAIVYAIKGQQQAFIRNVMPSAPGK